MLDQLAYVYPMKLISPSPTPNGRSVTVFALTYGGGLVSGDRTRLSVTVAPSSRVSLLTQGSTKIFRAAGRDVVTRQGMHVTIQGDGAFVYLPDPVQPFGESVYRQEQVLHVESTESSFCILDWVCEGRSARGETWDLWSWTSKNEVWSRRDGAEAPAPADVLALRDHVVLDHDRNGLSPETLRQRMDGLAVFGTLIVFGQLLDPVGRFFLEEFACLPRIGASYAPEQTQQTHASAGEGRRHERHQDERANGILWTAASVRRCVVVKFGAPDVEHGRAWLCRMLRDEGTLEKELGEECLHCLK